MTEMIVQGTRQLTESVTSCFLLFKEWQSSYDEIAQKVDKMVCLRVTEKTDLSRQVIEDCLKVCTGTPAVILDDVELDSVALRAAVDFCQIYSHHRKLYTFAPPQREVPHTRVPFKKGIGSK